MCSRVRGGPNLTKKSEGVKTLRVGLFTECYRPIQNGIVASLDVLADALRARGHEVLFVTPSMPGYQESDDDIVRVPSLPLPTRTAYRLTIPLVAPQRLANLSIVHTHSPFVTGWMGLRLARRQGVPLVFTYHTQLEEYAHYVPFDPRAARSAASQLTRSYANAADLVVVPTAAMHARLRALAVRSRIEIVPSGIDVRFFAGGRRNEALRARLGVPPDGKMLLSVGRLGREKNVELALDAFARLPDPSVRLVIVGDGVHREALERKAARSGVAGRTTFAREFAREALPDAYASADAFVFTSLSETQGLVLVEALAAGVPIVAVDTPQTRDVLGGAGTVVPATSGALAAALARVLAAGPHAAQISPIALRFDGPTLAGSMLDLYGDLLGHRRVPAGVPA
jgi:1,2-diacylglycerol 3-alpha-glucosyltransferase